MIRIAEQFGLTNLVYRKYTSNAYLYRRMSQQEGYRVALDTLKDHILYRDQLKVSLELSNGNRKLTVEVTLDSYDNI